MLICRCEEVYLHELEAIANNGVCTSQELKMKTRAGMGICQGRVCRSILEAWSNEQITGMLEQPSQLTIHHPVRPVYLRQLRERE